jgi:hypothetical protein
MWENGYSSGVEVRPQPASYELRERIDVRTPITEVRSPLLNDIGVTAVLQYRFGSAPIADSNAREAGTERLERRVIFPRVARSNVYTLRRIERDTAVE